MSSERHRVEEQIDSEHLPILQRNQILQELKKIRKMQEAKVTHGQNDYFKLSLTTKAIPQLFQVMWKSISLLNKGPDTAYVILTLVPPERRKKDRPLISEENIIETNEIDIDKDDEYVLSYSEDRILRLRAYTKSGTATLKVSVSR